MPLLKELSRTSRDSFESYYDSNDSRDDRLNSPKSGKKWNMPLFGELSRWSWDLFELDSDSNESRDVRLNSPKSGVFEFSRFWGKSWQTFDSIGSVFLSIRSILRLRVVVDRPDYVDTPSSAKVAESNRSWQSLCHKLVWLQRCHIRDYLDIH